MKGFVLLLSLFLGIGQAAPAQRLSRERLYLKQGLAYSSFDAILPLPNGQLLTESGDRTATLEEKSTRRLLSPTLDTVWTRTIFPFAGWQGLLQLPNGDCLGMGLIHQGTLPGGNLNTNVYLERISLTGRSRWQRSYEFGTVELGEGVAIAPDGGFLVLALTSYFAQRSQLYLLKTDTAGQEQWRRPHGWGGNEPIPHMRSSPTGRILVAGPTFLGGNTPAQLKLLLFNQYGDSVRGRLLAPLGPTTSMRTMDTQNSLLPLADGGWLLTGYRDSTRVPDQPFLLRLDSLLQPRWARRYRAPNNADVVYGGTCELQDGSLLVLAWQRQPLTTGFALHHYSATGQLLTIYPFTSAIAGTAVAPYLLTPTLNGRTLFVAGYGNPTLTSRQSYLATIDLQTLPGAVVLSSPTPVKPAVPAAWLDLFPNPTTAAVTVRFHLPLGAAKATVCFYDATGRLVRQQTLAGPSGQVRVTVAGLRSGLYVARLLGPDERVLATQKLSIEREDY